MKTSTALFLILMILLQCSMKLGIVAYYQLNKEYITANYCENKAKPAMKCNGKCYLNKKIKAQEQGENKLPSLLKEIKEVLLFVSLYSIDLPLQEPVSEMQAHMAYLEKSCTSPLANIFQPPQ